LFKNHSGLSSKSLSRGKTLKIRKINEKVERVRKMRGIFGAKNGGFAKR